MAIDFKNAAFISAYRGGYSEDRNTSRHASLAVALVKFGLEFEECKGEYRGVPERSYIVNAPGGESLAKVKQLARRYEQESLLLTADSVASLWFTEAGKSEVFGKIRELNLTEEFEDHTELADGRILAIV